MSALTTIQQFCLRTGITNPSSVVGSTDDQVLQIQALLNEEGIALSSRGDWEMLTLEATHTTLAQEDQGAIATIASGFRSFKNGTLWDRTSQLRLGSLNGDEWQAAKAITTSGPRYQVRIRRGRLLSSPAPAAGSTWAFEYVSKNWLLDNDGTTYKQYITEDADTILLPEHLVLSGLRWRWKKEKGLEYAEDFRDYEAMVNKELGSQGINRVLMMDEGERNSMPGMVIPDGSWAL